MRTKIVKQIFKKEMIDILRDKKTIFMMIILPLLLYPILMVGASSIMSMSINKMEQTTVNIAFNNNPSDNLINILNKTNEYDEAKVNIIKVDDYKEALDNETLDAYVEINENNDIQSYKIYTNSSKNNSYTAEKRIKEALDKYKEEIVEMNLAQEGLDAQKTLEPITCETLDIAKNEEIAGNILGQILPFILIIGVLLGSIYPAIDVMAGEKERGTLETLFTLPISNLELVMGKYMAVSFCAVVTAFLNIISILISIGFMTLTAGIANEMGIPKFDFTQMIFPGIITMICIGLFAMVVSAISMCVCSLAKSFKDAQNYITPVMLIIMIPSYVSMIPNIELDGFTSTIPVVNISLLIKSVLSFKFDLNLIAIVFVSNFAFMILSVLLLSKMFNSEEILFGNNRSFSFLEKRSNIKKGTMPTISDGAILYAVGLVLLIYVGSLVQLKFKMAGLAITQVMIICLPLLFAYYIKTDFKKTFSLRKINLKQILGGILIWMGGFVLINLITQITLYLFPQNMEVAEALTDAIIIKDNLVLNLAIVALMPAICEEIFFRGFIFTSFKGKSSSKIAIITSGILFGFMHMDFLRIIPTSILGIIFAYTVYKSESIFIAMILHFINNGIAVLVSHYPNSELVKMSSFIELDFKNLNIGKFIILICISTVFIIIGMRLFKNKSEKEVSVRNY
ncbi:MAG: CPBP family intramembrane metalloprotease [Romboutsia sp.]|uniref:ABC transporter permease subunit/CPBP intramembrane protease n=1 Tax=Romboutsia TaxID=1501226 RepID=UPI00216C96DB|nr:MULTISPECIES: ABC transporter permease subunit/CPBP intramembrane protease [Romboutsia]MCI9260376.1 CPBP family intramembrane metalloprotease [Romboutsia sp.]